MPSPVRRKRPTWRARIWAGGGSSESWKPGGGHLRLEILKGGLGVTQKCENVLIYYIRNPIRLSKPTWRPQIRVAGVSQEGQFPKGTYLDIESSKNDPGAGKVLKTTRYISFPLSL